MAKTTQMAQILRDDLRASNTGHSRASRGTDTPREVTPIKPSHESTVIQICIYFNCWCQTRVYSSDF